MALALWPQLSLAPQPFDVIVLDLQTPDLDVYGPGSRPESALGLPVNGASSRHRLTDTEIYPHQVNTHVGERENLADKHNAVPLAQGVHGSPLTGREMQVNKPTPGVHDHHRHEVGLRGDLSYFPAPTNPPA